MESAPDPGLEHVLLSGSINPRVIGRRVVVRSVVPGEVGPTGGPAFTDVLGMLESATEQTALVRRSDDEVIEIEIALIVSGKTVPPPPQRRHN